ncbi:ferrous iron transport protein A [Methanomicrobium antiquum]|uniref:Ferrous iron transport protein A n=1 Tax=Methanomicrobium antiquum TaxID=487686 RepID=A0AAF0FMP3_9EURY|nr:FeoA family protein [Methanomicrobium antiquum]WFN36615.1 ferrous iron transport protein A [Methanomicrobium antiquum]
MEKRLTNLEYGETGLIKEIKASSQNLSPIGIRVGKSVKMITKQPIKGPVVVMAGEVEVALGIEQAKEIIVDVTNGQNEPKNRLR